MDQKAFTEEGAASPNGRTITARAVNRLKKGRDGLVVRTLKGGGSGLKSSNTCSPNLCIFNGFHSGNANGTNAMAINQNGQSTFKHAFEFRG